MSAWPKYDGRFPSISGCRFTFDPRRPPGERINFEDVQTDSGPLDPNKVYKVAMKSFLAVGKDGYKVFVDGILSYVIDEEHATLIQEVMYSFFNSFGPNSEESFTS